jgi:deoxyribodipyrimidine photo-lyase
MKTLESILSDPRLTVRRAGAPDPEGRCVVYWMQRAQRAVDNPALNAAINTGNCLGKPVVVFFQLLPHAHHANQRHYQFLVEGLGDIAAELRKKKVGLVVRRLPDHGLLRFCSEVRPCLVISDENPLTEAERTKTKIAQKLSVPFWTVDADVVVPSRLFNKEHYAARTIRPKIQALLPQFLRKVENPTAKVAWRAPSRLVSLTPSLTLLNDFPIDRGVAPSAYFHGGSGAALRALERFLRYRLRGYATQRNKPDLDGTSQLSPYLHFGQISVHRIAIAARNSDAPAEDRRAFLEELIVRRELAVNFVRFNRDYENFDACEPWADVTHRKHAHDRRPFMYSEKQLESAETHDPLWNAAQKQMTLTGWMHGYLRMYWAKKILEWTESPQVAYQIAVQLNDRYELDGRDPNGYAGIAWAIVGKHDRAWGPERLVYGKIRYMSYSSTSRKFDCKTYIARITALEKGSPSEI